MLTKVISIAMITRQRQTDGDTVCRLEVTLVENPWWLQVTIIAIILFILIVLIMAEGPSSPISKCSQTLKPQSPVSTEELLSY